MGGGVLINWGGVLMNGGGSHQDGPVDFVPVRLHLSVGHGVVVQHGLQAGAIRRQVGEQDALHGLGGEKGGKGAQHPKIP